MYLTSPRGVVPRSQGCNLGPEYAAIAENIKLRHGRWEPWRVPKKVLDVPKSARAAHVRDCCWYTDDDCSAHFFDAGACEQTYLSRPHEQPLVSPDLCDYSWQYLGLPVPDAPVSYSNALCDKHCDATAVQLAYVITYCSECEEGPPSCPTALTLAEKDAEVVIMLPPRPDPLWGVTHVNIYRLEGTWDSSQGLVDFNPNAITGGFTSPVVEQNFFRVGTVEVEANSFTDAAAKPCELLTTEDFYPPDKGLQIGGETASGSLVGWIDHEVWFSERNAYHAWPLKARMMFPYKVKQVCVCDNTVFVLTEANAFVIQDSVDCRDSACRPVSEAKDVYPLCSAQSCVVLPNAVLYSSVDGLVLLNADTSSRIVSGLAFAKDDWRALGPTDIRVEKAENYLFLITDRVFFVWVLSFNDSGQLPEDLTTLDFVPDRLIIDDQERLFFLLEGAVYEFDAGNEYMTMTWRQAAQDDGTQTLVTALRAKYINKKAVDLNIVSLFQDERLIMRRPLPEKPIKTRGRLGCRSQVEITGKEPQCGLYYGVGFSNLERA